MKILIAATPALGHINPLLSIARIFISHRHEVIFQTASVFRDQVERAGVPFRPFLPGADLDLRDVDAALPERKHLAPGPEMLRFDFERVFIDPVPHQDASLRAILRDWPADVILADNTFYGTIPMLLGDRAERPAIVHCGISCLFTDRDDGAPPMVGLPPATSDAQRKDYAAIHAKVTAELFDPLRQYFDMRLTELGVRPLPVGVFGATAELADLYLQPTVPGFEYPSSGMPPSVHFVGALPMPRSGAARPDWADELDGTRRVVLVTQGTVANHDLGQVIAPTLAALADEPDLLVLATTGGRPLDAIKGPIPANVRLSKFLPFDWLLPKVDVVVTNGGYGTLSYALELGIPLVVAGQTEDKAEISARVAWSGVGVNLATNNPTPEALRKAVRDVLDKPQYRERAAALSREFANYDAEPDIIRLVGEVAAERQCMAAAAE
jgi:MGT family glycosyltransferase